MNDLVTTLTGEEKVEVVQAIAGAAAYYKRLSMGLDGVLQQLQGQPLEHVADGYLIKTLENITPYELPIITYWKQRLNV